MAKFNPRHSNRFSPKTEESALTKLSGKINLPLSVFAIVPNAIFHTGLGGRFLTWWRIIAAEFFILFSYAIWICGIKVWVWQILPKHHHTIWSVEFFFIALFSGTALVNKILSIINRRKEVYHAYDRGFSWFSYLINAPYWVLAWIEPLFILSLSVWTDSFFVKSWVGVCGISLFLHTNIDFICFNFAVDDRSSSLAEASEYQTKTLETANHMTTIVAKRR